MGEVYRARDLRLNRDVAIKVLPADRVGDDRRRRRFVQEAQAVSALNHPHIITIYEIESANGIDFVVMEYVRGKSLDTLIPHRGMRLNEFLRIAIPIADALTAAHVHGIIHCDLKPANVMVGTDGAVKVLDFGLAKLMGDERAADETDSASQFHRISSRDADPAETITAAGAVSAPGKIAGTPAYMAPEQALGERLDARSDIFSFGAMLYEMLTGDCAFVGASTAETLAAVVRAQPKPLGEIVPNTPGDLHKLISRCLRRDPERRFQHISDVRVALQEIKEDSESGSAAAVPTSRLYRGVMITAFIGVVSVLAALTWLLRFPHRTEAPPPRVLPLTSLPGFEGGPALSPDGNQVAFAWSGEKNDNWDIYLKFVGSSEMRRLTTDPLEDGMPRWSPDGRQIAFKRCQPDVGCQLRLISAMGGTDSKISDLRFAWSPLDWSPDGRFIVAGISQQLARQEPAGLYLVPVAGGTPRRLTTPKGVTDQAPAFSRDGRRLAYASCSATGFAACDVYVLDLDTAFTPVGQARRLTSQGAAIWTLTWSRNGQSIIYDAQAVPLLAYLWSVDVAGHDQPVRIEVAGARAFSPATTSAMDRLVFSRSLLDNDVYEMAWGHPPQPVAASSFDDFLPHFSPDGRQIAFCSARESGESVELWIASADGSGARQLTRGLHGCAGVWSPNGQQIAFDSYEDGRWHIWLIDPDGGTPRQVTADPGSQRAPSWSHDGQWLYYWLQQSDHGDLWRTRLSDGVKEQLTHDGNTVFGVELFDGSHFLYQTESRAIMEAPLEGGSARQLVKCAIRMAFAAGPKGIYYAGCEPRSDPPVYLLNPATGTQRWLGHLEKLTQSMPIAGLGISPDGTRVLYTREVSNGGDLMMIENFR
jgi:serine/threonine protein kinase/Tol biopolymer transport system component